MGQVGPTGDVRGPFRPEMKPKLPRSDAKASKVAAERLLQKSPTPTNRTFVQRVREFLKGRPSQPPPSLKKEEALASFQKKPLPPSELDRHIDNLFSREKSPFDALKGARNATQKSIHRKILHVTWCVLA